MRLHEHGHRYLIISMLLMMVSVQSFSIHFHFAACEDEDQSSVHVHAHALYNMHDDHLSHTGYPKDSSTMVTSKNTATDWHNCENPLPKIRGLEHRQ